MPVARCEPSRTSMTFVPAGAMALLLASPASAATPDRPGCEGIDARQCVALAMEAIGRQGALQRISNTQFDIAIHTLPTEQSYRRAPFIKSYGRVKETVDFAKTRLGADVDSLWPEADPDTASAQSPVALVVPPQRGASNG